MRSVHAQAVRKGGSLFLSYRIEGTLRDLLLPAPGLKPIWQHTCCELFVARKGMTAYHEFNFSPSGEWAAYAFTDYRQGAPLAAPDPRIAVRPATKTLELEAFVSVPGQNLLLGLSAVIEDRDGTLSYWALRHAPGKPDFHHRSAFALELA